MSLRASIVVRPLGWLLAALGLLLPGFGACSSRNDDTGALGSNPTRQARAVQSSLAEALATQAPAPAARDGRGPGPAAPVGMGRMLGQPLAVTGLGDAGALPSAVGGPHLYHLGADNFFLDQASAIALTSEQQTSLAALQEKPTAAYAAAQAAIDRGEQELWVLTSLEAPDSSRIEGAIGEIARLGGQQRIEFIRAVGAAVAVLSDSQRRAVSASGQGVRPDGLATSAPSQASAAAPGGSTPTPGLANAGISDAGPPGGKGQR